MILLVVFVISAFFLFRSTLILMGLYKDPILHSFEKYGDDETFYFPLVQFLIWLPIFVLVLGFWLFEAKIPASIKSPVSLYCLSLMLMTGGFAGYTRLKQFARRHAEWFLVYPRWYGDLRERTNRLERRRISYMWLYLPWKLRLMYNSNDRAFNLWVDLVLLATIRREDDRVVDPSVRMWS